MVAVRVKSTIHPRRQLDKERGCVNDQAQGPMGGIIIGSGEDLRKECSVRCMMLSGIDRGRYVGFEFRRHGLSSAKICRG